MTTTNHTALTTRSPIQAGQAFVLAVRGILIGGLAAGFIFNLPQLEGKGWVARTAFYSLIMLVMPTLCHFKKNVRYSAVSDALLVLPFALDIYGNLTGLFDSVNNFDNYLHFINWVSLVASLVLTTTLSSELSRGNLLMIGVGAGALASVLWETMEYYVMKLGTESLHLTYPDTISDLDLSTTGGLVGALLVVKFTALRRQ